MEEIIIRYMLKNKITGEIAKNIFPIEEIEEYTKFDRFDLKKWEIIGRDLFSGLKDIKGIKIFDNDIIANSIEIAGIVYSKNTARFVASTKYGCLSLYVYLEKNRDSVIIGNRYQNPESVNV